MSMASNTVMKGGSKVANSTTGTLKMDPRKKKLFGGVLGKDSAGTSTNDFGAAKSTVQSSTVFSLDVAQDEKMHPHEVSFALKSTNRSYI